MTWRKVRNAENSDLPARPPRPLPDRTIPAGLLDEPLQPPPRDRFGSMRGGFVGPEEHEKPQEHSKRLGTAERNCSVAQYPPEGERFRKTADSEGRKRKSADENSTRLGLAAGDLRFWFKDLDSRREYRIHLPRPRVPYRRHRGSTALPYSSHPWTAPNPSVKGVAYRNHRSIQRWGLQVCNWGRNR